MWHMASTVILQLPAKITMQYLTNRQFNFILVFILYLYSIYLSLLPFYLILRASRTSISRKSICTNS